MSLRYLMICGYITLVSQGLIISTIDSNQWNQITINTQAELIPRFGHTAVVNKGKMYIFGGWDGNQTMSDILEYNLSSDSWKLISPV